jgi:hypothetical protein
MRAEVRVVDEAHTSKTAPTLNVTRDKIPLTSVRSTIQT